MKKITAFLLAVLLLALMASPASAAAQDGIMPRYTYVSSVYARLDIDTTWGIATCEGRLDAYYFNPVKLTVTLQQNQDDVWVTLKSWMVEEDYGGAALLKNYAIMSGYEYRVYVFGYVYDENGKLLEVVYVSDQEYYPKTGIF